MNRFVILEHDWPRRHWDLLLEVGDTLKSWRIDTEPTLGHSHEIELRPDHRTFYLDYEGPVSGNRGSVIRWDWGTYQWLSQSTLQLQGQRLQALATLHWNDNGVGIITLSEQIRSVDPTPGL